MPTFYPDDADGDALRRVERAGSNMSEPMVIEFFLVVPSELAATTVLASVVNRGYDAKVDYDTEGNEWTVVCSRRIIPTYEAVLQSQAELENLSKQQSGFCDGWGTLGNAK